MHPTRKTQLDLFGDGQTATVEPPARETAYQDPRTEAEIHRVHSEAEERREGERLRDDGIANAEAGASQWCDRAFAIVESVAATTYEFTTDRIWHELKGDKPENHKAMGPVMLRAARAKLISNTMRMVKSARKDCHCRPIPVWRSLVCTSGEAPSE